jgi:hypothetical protein
MKAIFVALIPIVASFIAAAAISKVVGKSEGILPNAKSGAMPIGNARFGDSCPFDGTRSFWQLDFHKKNIF